MGAGAGGGEIVEGGLGRLDDVALDEGGALGGALFGGFDAALPFENGPAGEIVLGEFRKDGWEIDLAVAGGAETARALQPRLITAVNALAAGGIKFGVLDVKHFDAGVVEVDELDVVELLEDEVAGVEENVGAGMIADAVEKHFERGAVVEIFTGMDFEAEVDAGAIEGVENGEPALGELVEGGFDEAGGALRPGIDVGPGKRAGEGDVSFEAEIRGSAGGLVELLDGPGLALLRMAVEIFWSETVEHGVVGGMAGDELALEMRREFGNGKFVASGDGLQIVAIGFAFGRALEIEQASVPGRDLHGDVTEICRPGADRVEGVERRIIRGKLREKNSRALHRFHGCAPAACGTGL